ncbi:MAG: universal stress protein [Thermodesulfobacteriota bacterium]
MFKKILFATSGSPACDNAARVAFDMAKRYDAELVLFHSLGIPTRGYSQIVVDVRTGEEVSFDADYTTWVEEELRTTYAKQLETLSKARLEIRVGLPHTEILRLARQEEADLIVMGASTRESEPEAPHRRGFAGSTLQKVARGAKCPVLTIHRPVASFWGGFSNIVFGTDFSKAANYAFRFALNVAKELDCKLHIFHALDINTTVGQFQAQDSIEDNLIAARRRMRALYEPQMDGFSNYEFEVWEGVPFVEIVKFTRERQADLLVMAHHTRETDPEKARLGSTLEQVALRATCPVASLNRAPKEEGKEA